MSRWLIALLVAVGIVAVWLRQREQQSAWREIDTPRRMPAVAPPPVRQPAPEASTATAPNTANAAARAEERQDGELDGGGFQDAADRATGQGYERATGELEELSSELASARRQAERQAGRLSDEAAAAIAAIHAAAEAHGGAVPGDGSLDCPADYPIKGSLAQRRYFAPGDPEFDRTIPDLCLQTTAAAEAAGFSPVASEAVVAEGIAAAEIADVPPGAVRGDGGRECPPAYPIKGNANSMLYHEPGSRSYTVTIPEFCFADAASAEAAGFSAPRR